MYEISHHHRSFLKIAMLYFCLSLCIWSPASAGDMEVVGQGGATDGTNGLPDIQQINDSEIISGNVRVSGGKGANAMLNGPTPGGNGGDAQLTMNGSMKVTSGVSLVGGDGGTSGNGGYWGGSGGAATLIVTGNLDATQSIIVSSGNGGDNQQIDRGGDGGRAQLSVGGSLATNQNIELRGGNGGISDSAIDGGTSLDAELNVSGSVSANNIFMSGGTGGDDTANNAGKGGNGGGTVFAADMVSVTQSITLISGNNGNGVGPDDGKGGGKFFGDKRKRPVH